MSWLFYPLTRPEREEILSLYRNDTAEKKSEMIAAKKVGGVWYCAVKVYRAPEDAHSKNFVKAADGSYTFGMVILTKRERGVWGYNDMSEIMGPAYYEAPASIMALLSPLDPAGNHAAYAADWRATVASMAKVKSLPEGTKLVLSQPFEMKKREVKEVIVSHYETRTGVRKRAYYAPAAKSLVRLSDWRLVDAQVIA